MRCAMTLSCAAALGAVCLLCACSREQPPDTSAGAPMISEGREGVTVTSRDGSVTIAGNENAGHIRVRTGEGDEVKMSYTRSGLAEGFPEDIPLYEPAQIVMSQVFNNGRNAVATLTTSHSPERAADFYRAELARQGWAVGGEMSVGGMVMLQGRKEGYNLNLTALPVEGQTKINLAKTEAEE